MASWQRFLSQLGVIQRVAANAALAIALLGFGPNVASAAAPVFDPFSPNPLAGQVVGLRASPTLGDLDGDGDLELVSGEYAGSFRYFQNIGSAMLPVYVEQAGAANPLLGFSAASVHSQPALVDLDDDGDFDLVAGDRLGSLHSFENTGSATNPLFVERVGMANPLDGLGVGSGLGALASPALGDADGDGDLDLVVGEFVGSFRYFENTGSAIAPAYIARTGADTPLDGQSVGLNSSPSFVDLDADGDRDVVSGDRNGRFKTDYLPEPSTSLLLTAGMGLLRWLAARRRR